MKRIFILMISLCFIVILMVECGLFYSKDRAKFTITDFSKKRVDTLIPHKDKSYVAFLTIVKGYTNDTIIIKWDGYYGDTLSGVIDTVFNPDYYGTNKVISIFDPYKATEGNLEIEYVLF